MAENTLGNCRNWSGPTLWEFMQIFLLCPIFDPALYDETCYAFFLICSKSFETNLTRASTYYLGGGFKDVLFLQQSIGK